LLQSPSVRPLLADDDSETGEFEIPAGSRRFQALSLFVKQNCLVDEEIAVTFFVTPKVAKQHLKFAAVAPALLELYAEYEMTMEQVAPPDLSDLNGNFNAGFRQSYRLCRYRGL
jgi:ParB family transcriptional regulator, chromosome partitioning protein